MTDWNKTAEAIIENLGGVENITNLSHCITRLRFTLKDDSKANVQAIKNIDGVLGYNLQGTQHQVIIGPAVENAFQAVTKLVGDKVNVTKEMVDAEKADAEALENAKGKKWGVKPAIDALTAILSPIIPAYCAAGMLKVVLLMLTSFHLATGEEGAYVFLNMVGDVAFYFLPIIVAVSAAKRFKVDLGLAAIVGGALLYPDFVSMVANGEQATFFGLNIPMVKYSSSIFPALLGVWLLSYVYRFFNKLIKNDAVRLMLVPVLSILVTVPVNMLLIAPLATWGANLLTGAFTWMMTHIGPIAGLVIGFLLPVMTLTGLHRALGPMEILEVSTYGYSRCLAIELYHNFAEAGAAFGCSVFTKDKKMKAVAATTGAEAFIGVSEPALYGVMVNDRAAMLSAMIGNGIGGFLGVLLNVKMYAFVWPNVFEIPTVMGDGGVPFLLAGLVAIAGAFVSSFLLYPALNKVLNKNN